VLIIGLMSGTSADGIDAALVEWPDGEAARPFQLRGFVEQPHPPDLQRRIHQLADGRVNAASALSEFASLDVELGERFSGAARAVAERAGVELAEVRAIASHGQTVAHHPERRASLQIGDPSVIAERTGCAVIADFRARDLAAGGEGAPLAPFFHHAVMTSDREDRAILNLGGIANITWLPAGVSADQVVAFDTGPANSLIDGVVAAFSDGAERMDRDGARARRGSIDRALLADLLDDEYLRRSPPKSTGREHYGHAEAIALAKSWREAQRPEDDLVATLVAFTAESVAAAIREHLAASRPGRVLVAGGGAANPAMMRGLERALKGWSVESVDAVGVPSAAVEAMAFSLMGRNALLGLPNHLPATTGATRSAVLGEVVPGR
jgi:anhydro-N-acetylmuramic acid kinase